MIYTFMKRMLDLLLAVLLLLLLSPVLLILYLFTGIFRAPRLGKNAVPFTMYKFKTMRDGEGTDMERLTSLGRFCRKYSLDEWPQLLNIIKGEMSFIGPRPLPVIYDPLIKGDYRRRFEVLPGITGLVQVKGRNSLTWREKFEYDLCYVITRGFLMDTKILLATFKVVLLGADVNSGAEQTMEEFKGFEE